MGAVQRNWRMLATLAGALWLALIMTNLLPLDSTPQGCARLLGRQPC
jgi:hypothetical protein